MESSSSRVSRDISNRSADSKVQDIRMISPSPNQVANLPPNHPQLPPSLLQQQQHNSSFRNYNRGSQPRSHNGSSNMLVENPSGYARPYSPCWANATYSLPFNFPPARSHGYGAPMIPPPYRGFVPRVEYYIPPNFGPHNYMYNPSSSAPSPWAYQARPPQDSSLYWRIINQVNYYFSDKNLRIDGYLKQHMDDNGWVPITLIAGFRRMKQLTDDIGYILFALQGSSVVEVEGDKIRRRNKMRR